MPEMKQDRLALDRASVRSIDKTSGHLHVSLTNISKSNVCGYYGKEIPGFEELGLDPDRIYQLLRDPAELAKGASTFNGKPLLIIHKPQQAATHDHELVVGSISNAVFNPPYLQAELSVWDGDAIALIESGEQRQLSSGYFYRAAMDPGTYEGVNFDGRMTDIVGNHVALVTEGRAGPDVYVGDSKPEPLITIPESTPEPAPESVRDTTVNNRRGYRNMANTRAQPLSRRGLLASGALSAYMTPKLATDASIDVTRLLKGVTAKNWKTSKPKIAASLSKAVEGKLAQDADIADVVELLDQLDDITDELDDVSVVAAADPDAATDDGDLISKVKALLEGASPEEIDAVCAAIKPAAAVDESKDDKDDDKDDDKKNPFAKDASKDDDEEPKISKSAMDAAIVAAVSKATRVAEANTMQRLRSIAEAERAVRPYIGELKIAQDSAEAIYRLCLEHAEVDLEGVPEAAYPAMVRMLQKPSEVAPVARARVAMDSAAMSDLARKFPGVNALKHR